MPVGVFENGLHSLIEHAMAFLILIRSVGVGAILSKPALGWIVHAQAR
jgi:hypothetical protein